MPTPTRPHQPLNLDDPYTFWGGMFRCAALAAEPPKVLLVEYALENREQRVYFEGHRDGAVVLTSNALAALDAATTDTDAGSTEELTLSLMGRKHRLFGHIRNNQVLFPLSAPFWQWMVRGLAQEQAQGLDTALGDTTTERAPSRPRL